jgi:hypothetical protein
MPLPTGGALVTIASDLPHAETPTSVMIPAGKTDAMVSPPLRRCRCRAPRSAFIRAAYAVAGSKLARIVADPLGLSLSAERGRRRRNLPDGDGVTLLHPAPPGGVEVTLVSGDTHLVVPPGERLHSGGRDRHDVQHYDGTGFDPHARDH